MPVVDIPLGHRAWRTFSARRTEADYQAWRDHRDWIARKYAMRDRGEQVPLRP